MECPSYTSIPASQLTKRGHLLFGSHPLRLLTPRRWDIAVKWRFFRRLLGGDDPDAERVYRWHIEKRRKANARLNIGMDGNKAADTAYVPAARALFGSMRRQGFQPYCPVPVGRNGEILDGAHRTACAIALGLGEVPCEASATIAWAPHWGRSWFVENDMPQADLDRLEVDYAGLIQKQQALVD